MNRIPLITIGISGPSGSGKSLFCSRLSEELIQHKIEVIKQDCYYKNQIHLDFEERSKLNYDHPEAFDNTLFVQHVGKLRNGIKINVPTYDFAKHLRKSSTVIVKPPNVLILEGIMLFVDDKLKKMIDIKVFMDSPLDICICRRIQRDLLERGRDISSIIEQYHKYTRPMYFKFIEPSKKFADIIIPKGGANTIALDIMKAKVKTLLVS